VTFGSISSAKYGTHPTVATRYSCTDIYLCLMIVCYDISWMLHDNVYIM
jgi:hypothetical protein